MERGFPFCPKCSQEFQRVDKFLQHIYKGGCTEMCTYPGCTVEVIKKSKETHARMHGFPDCTVCADKPTFTRVDKFYVHMRNHKFNDCVITSCMIKVLEGDELQHAKEFHNYPNCSSCGEEFSRYDHFYNHIKRRSCEAPVPQKCPYPDCIGTVFLNRAEITKQHLNAVHKGMICQKCNKEKAANISSFLKHVHKCYGAVAGVQCSGCTFRARTEADLQTHMCVPLTDGDSYGGFQDALAVYDNPDVATPVHIQSVFASVPSRTSLCRLNESSLQYNFFADQDTKVKSRSKFHQDPTCSEMVSLHDLPVVALFLPREETFENKMRILYELEYGTDDNDWMLWCILVDRVHSLACDLERGDDYKFLQKCLNRIPLPPGVDEKFRDLLMVKSHMSYIKQRARQHTHLQVMYESASGERPLGRYMRRINKSRDVPEFRLHKNEVALTTTSLPTNTVPMTAKEARWDNLICNFYRDVLLPVVESRTFTRLRSVESLQLNFFGDNNFMLSTHRTKRERLRPKELKELPTDPHILQCYRSSQAIQQTRLRMYDADVQSGEWCNDKELSSNGSIALKRDESMLVHHRVRQLLNASPEVRHANPLHPRRVPVVHGGGASALEYVTPSASSFAHPDAKRARVSEVDDE